MRPTDTTRVVRAHELLAVGRSFADVANGDELWTAATRMPTSLVGLTMDRALLRERAAERMTAMVAAGAMEEVRRADTAGASPTARAAVGFAELLAGDAERAITKTRQLAKRQETWMRRLGGARLLDVTGRTPDEVAAEILSVREP